MSRHPWLACPGKTLRLPSSLPVISYSAATQATIMAGLSAALSWNVSGATALGIDNGVGDVSRANVQVRFANPDDHI